MKKQSIVLRRESYSLLRVSDSELAIFAFFLTDDLGGFVDAYKKWAQNIEEEKTGGNYANLKKVGENIIISFAYDEECGITDGVVFKISKDNFLELLDKWEHLYRIKPKKITIIKIGNRIMLEPSNTLDPEDIR